MILQKYRSNIAIYWKYHNNISSILQYYVEYYDIFTRVYLSSQHYKSIICK